MLLDALCSRHSHEIQVKAVSGVASDRLTAAAYAAMAERLAVGSLPDYLVVSYDVLRATVVLAEFIDGNSHDASVHARTALGPTARRAGWIGASIDLAGLERQVVVARRAFRSHVATSSPATIDTSSFASVAHPEPTERIR